MWCRWGFLLFSYIVFASLGASAEQISSVSAHGFYCRMNDAGRTELVSLKNNSYVVTNRKTRERWRTQRAVLRKKLRRLRLKAAAKNGGGERSSKSIERTKNQLARLRDILSFVKQCREKDPTLFQVPDPTPTPTPSVTPTPPVTPTPTPSVPAKLENFSHFESAHVRPLALHIGRSRLYVVNTEEGQLEVFDLSQPENPQYLRSIPVGVEPVSVRIRNSSEAWVVNHIGDSVSVVDLNLETTIRTIPTGHGPTDVAFDEVSGRACVTVAFEHRLECFQLSNLGQAVQHVPLPGNRPWEIERGSNGRFVVRFQLSGNNTAIIGRGKVSDPNAPSQGVNPLPNGVNNFSPPMAPGLSTPPRVGLIVRKAPGTSVYRDEQGRDWTSWIESEGVTYDVAFISTQSLEVLELASSELTTTGKLLLHPSTGAVTVFGKRALNHIRFEPNLKGRFIREVAVRYGGAAQMLDQNPHLTYSSSEVDAQQSSSTHSEARKRASIAGIRGAVWNGNSSKIFVVAQETNSIYRVNATGERDTTVSPVRVGEGPTDILRHGSAGILYVLNRFDSSVSVLQESNLQELVRVPLFAYIPLEIRKGRKMLFDSQYSSEMGMVSCASCHIDGRIDQLAWDLGNPQGSVVSGKISCFPEQNQNECNSFDFHPMKGPMSTQTLIGRRVDRPLHWRGEKKNLGEFAPAFVGLLGRREQPTTREMSDFATYLSSIQEIPPPHRTLDDQTPTIEIQSGRPDAGEFLFTLGCNACHDQTQGGTEFRLHPLMGIIEAPDEPIRTAPLNDLLYRDIDNNLVTGINRSAFGVVHNGALRLGGPSNAEFDGSFLKKVFILVDHPGAREGVQMMTGGSSLPTDDDLMRHLRAFLLAFPNSSHPAVGTVLTFSHVTTLDAASLATLTTLTQLGNEGKIALMVSLKRPSENYHRKFLLIPGGNGLFYSDRKETLSPIDLLSLSNQDSPLTFRALPSNMLVRSIDRDDDDCPDGVEILSDTDPLNPLSRPAECTWEN